MVAKLAYWCGIQAALIKLGAPIDLTPEQLAKLRQGAHFNAVFTPEQLAEVRRAGGMGAAAHPAPQPMSPTAKSYMDRLTGRGTPTAALHPGLAKSQRELRHAIGTAIPTDLIAASEFPYSRFSDDGLRRATSQMRDVASWSKQQGHTLLNAPKSLAELKRSLSELPAPAQLPQGTQGIANTVRAPVSSGTLGTANTVHAPAPLPRKVPTIVKLPAQLLRRFARI